MSIDFDAGTGTYLLRTPGSAYALRLTESAPRFVYWGPPIELAEAATQLPPPDTEEVLGEEYSGEGGHRFGPPGLRVEFADGTRAVQWRPAEHAASGTELRVTLVDDHYPLAVDLWYRVHSDVDVIERWVTLRHTGSGADAPIVVERVDSAAWTLPPRPDYRLSYVAGEACAEFQLQRDRLPRAETVLTSRRGTTRHQVNPWVMVDAGDAYEEQGEVWSTALGWSGGFHVTVRRTLRDVVTVTGGAGHDGAHWSLRPGETFETPVFAGLYSGSGFGATSRQWHRFALRHVLPVPGELRPVLYNGWEGTWFDISEANQRHLAAIAASLGVELFVMDDGWFGGRVHDRAGLGDWWPNPDRFPNGLGPLIEDVHRLGMGFGLWVEPEMVNPDSDLYRAHPDWVLHMANRGRTEHRHQLVLNFARPDVVEWAHGWLDRLLTDNAIDFLKWDMNRSLTEPSWPDGDDPGRLWNDYTANIYAIIDRLRAAHPRVRIESCASGGGRVDFGIMRRTDQVWTSDNTDPVDRIPIQHGYGQVYPAIAMGAWASRSPNPITGREAPLRFRFHVAMAGALGVSGDLRTWSAQERAEAAELIGDYRRIRHIVQHGQLYRLAAGRTTVVGYVTDDEAVVLAWRPDAGVDGDLTRVRLAGLDPTAVYAGADGTLHKGATLLADGLDLGLNADELASTLIHFRRA